MTSEPTTTPDPSPQFLDSNWTLVRTPMGGTTHLNCSVERLRDYQVNCSANFYRPNINMVWQPVSYFHIWFCGMWASQIKECTKAARLQVMVFPRDIALYCDHFLNVCLLVSGIQNTREKKSKALKTMVKWAKCSHILHLHSKAKKKTLQTFFIKTQNRKSVSPRTNRKQQYCNAV